MSTGDHDLDAAISNNGPEMSAPVATILATIEGENDGPSWHWIVKLENGRLAYIEGACDYTGWDCQSSCYVHEAETIPEVLRLVGEAEREILQGQLT